MGNNFCEGDINFETFFLSPEKHIYSEDERERFRAYQQELAKESDIQMVWKWYSNYSFPFNLNPYIDAMEKMLPDNTEKFAEYCNRLNAPVLLHEIFAVCRKRYGKDFFTIFLKKCSSCTENEKNIIWDASSFAAPISLDCFFLTLTVDFPLGGKIDECDIEERSRKIGQVLLRRPDGYFLVWNYIKYLLSKDIKNPDVTWLFIKTIGITCKPILDAYYEGKDWLKSLRPSGFSLTKNREHFSQTGILAHPTKESMYLNLLAQMQFNQKDNLASYLPYFEDSILIEDEMFRAFDSKPSLHHYYIAEIYLVSDDPLAKWLETWEKMQSGRYRVWFNRYDATSAAIVKNLNFLLLVGIALMERIYSSNTEDEERGGAGLQFCEKLWDLLKDMTIKRERNISQIHSEMIYYLAAWRFLFIKEFYEEVAMNQMTEFLIKESLSPRLFLNVLNTLLNNGFTSLQYISYENKKAFQQKILWNTQYAIDLTPSEDRLGLLGKYIKSKFKSGEMI